MEKLTRMLGRVSGLFTGIVAGGGLLFVAEFAG